MDFSWWIFWMKEGTGGHYGIINVEISTNKFPDIIENDD